jgi:uncharacterized tellurite resistance protein B-like protein
MFRSIAFFIENRLGSSSSRPRVGDCSLATTALLVRVATVHHEMTEARGMMLHDLVKSRFQLDDRTTALLVKESTAAVRAAIDLYRFTRQLNEVLDQEGRRQIIQLMWQIVYADGIAEDFEANLIWRTADLLGVSTRQRVELRQRVLADAPALARELFRNINSRSSAV